MAPISTPNNVPDAFVHHVDMYRAIPASLFGALLAQVSLMGFGGWFGCKTEDSTRPSTFISSIAWLPATRDRAATGVDRHRPSQADGSRLRENTGGPNSVREYI